MTKPLTEPSGKPLGRPTLYRPEYDQLAENYCLLGATDKQLADYFKTTESTIYEWKLRHPSFSEAIARGKDEADAKVSKSLYNRALGAVESQTTISRGLRKDKETGKLTMAVTGETTVSRELAPETKACEFWLKNRAPHLWREKLEIEQTTAMSAFKDTEFDGMTRDQALMFIGQVVEALPLAQRVALAAQMTSNHLIYDN